MQLLIRALHLRVIVVDVLAAEPEEFVVVSWFEVVPARAVDRSHLVLLDYAARVSLAAGRRVAIPASRSQVALHLVLRLAVGALRSGHRRRTGRDSRRRSRGRRVAPRAAARTRRSESTARPRCGR